MAAYHFQGDAEQRSAFRNAASGAREIESVEQDYFPSYALCRAETNHLHTLLQPTSNPCAQYYPVAARREKRSKLLLVIKPRMTSTFRKMNLSR